MIKTYIRIELSSEGESPTQIIERMRQIDAVPVIGEYDFELSLGEDEKLFDRLEDIHHVLRGSSVRYTITTRTDVDEAAMNNGTREITHMVDQKPVELRKKLYRAKLQRWREMGLDVDELEQLLDEDLDKFKVASRTFLKTHLDSISVVKDKHPPQNLMDGEILSLITEEGKTLRDLMALTGYPEDSITLSLGRLISAGSTILDSAGKAEVYRLVPPPAPPMRKALKVLDAAGEEDAEERIMNALRPNGSTKGQLVRISRLPPEQATKALASLSKKGRLRVVRKGNRALFYPA